eukprot:UN05269
MVFLNIELGDKISKAILDDVVRAEQQRTGQLEIELSGDDLVTIDNNSYTYSQLLQPLVETITGKIMSIGWSLLSLNTAIGGIFRVSCVIWTYINNNTKCQSFRIIVYHL